MSLNVVSSPSILVPLPIPSGFSAQDATFLGQAFQLNASEIVEANLAPSLSTNPATQQFASWMASNHSAAAASLGLIAAQLGLTLPGTFTPDQQAEFAQLQGQSGAGFDTLYSIDEVKDHQQTLTLFQQEAANGQNAAVKSYAEQLIPTLQGHLNGAAILATAATGTPLPLMNVAPPPTVPGSGPPLGTPNAQDIVFAKAASISNLAEVAQGQFAVQQVGNVGGTEFAAWMVSDHSGAEASLQALASQEGVTIPTGLDQPNQQLLTGLQSLTDGNFFAAYVTGQIVSHSQTLSAFIHEVQSGRDPALTSYASVGIPVLSQHLQAALTLERTVPGTLAAAPEVNSALTGLLNTAAASGNTALLNDLTAIANLQPGFTYPPAPSGAGASVVADASANVPVMLAMR